MSITYAQLRAERSPMSKRQSRRAAARGMTLAHFVAECIRCAGVVAPETGHFTPAIAQRAHERKTTTVINRQQAKES